MNVKAVEIGNYDWSGLAATSRKDGIIYLNRDNWNGKKYETKLFCLFHEEGHIVLDTASEFDADDYARTQYIKQGYSLKEAYVALADMINTDSELNRRRIKRHWVALMLYDAIENGNRQALNDLIKTKI